MSKPPLVVIAGMGKGLGYGIAEFFLAKGYRVIGLNRSACDSNNIVSYQVDISDAEAIQPIAETLIQEHGIPDVLIHNTQQLLIADFESTSSEQFENCWRAITLSAFLLAQYFLPAMKERGSGAMIVSGATASIRGGAKFSAFSSAKFALRGLVQSLARSYQKDGIHVAHVLLDGIVNSENSRKLHSLETEKMMSPADIAEVYWQLVNQPLSTWVHELDLRPASETF